MTLSRRKTVVFNNSSDHFVIKADHFVEKFWVFNVIAFLIAVVGQSARNQLFFSNVLESQKFTCILILTVVKVVTSVTCLRIKSSITWNWGSIGWWSVVCCRHGRTQTRPFFFQFLQFYKDFCHCFLAFFFKYCCFTYSNWSFTITEIRSAWLAWNLAVYPMPVLLEVVLNAFKSI